MRERRTLVLAGLLVAAIAAIPIAGMAATGDTVAQTDNSTTTEANATNASVAPGERLAGVVNVQEAELEGEVDERAFGIQVANATSNQSKADVVNGQLSDIDQRLTELQERKQELREARNDSKISEGRYRAEMSELAAKTETAKRLASQSENVSQGLPADVLEANDVSVSAIQMMQERAGNLSGPEVAEIARHIAGPNVGGPPGDRGPAERPERPGQGGPEERPGGQQTPGDNMTAGERMADGEQMPGDNMTDGMQTPDDNTTDSEQTSDGEQTTDSDQTTDDSTADGQQTATSRSGY
jgi:hypothetical protein